MAERVEAVGKAERAIAKGQRPACLWFTGLSGSGKTTLARLVERRLHAAGRHTYVIDGDEVRLGLCRDLGFTSDDRAENSRRVAEVARLMADAGLIVIVALISPFAADRDRARSLFPHGDFLEIYLDAPLAVCEQRDSKGLYARARALEIANFTAISSPYEAPDAPDVRLASGVQPPDMLADDLIAALSRLGVLGPGSSTAY